MPAIRDRLAERPLLGAEFSALRLLERMAEAVPGVLVAQVGQGRHTQGGGEPVAGAGGVVLAVEAHRGRLAAASGPGRR